MAFLRCARLSQRDLDWGARGGIVAGATVAFEKQCIPSATLNKARRDLTLTPFSMMGGTKQFGEPIKGFRESKDFIYVPRGYAFGKENALSLGESMAPDVVFNGRLRGRLQEQFVQKMDEFVERNLARGSALALGSAEPGCGKTVMFLYLAAKWKRKTLVIVKGTAIVSQWVQAVRRFLPKATVGVIHQNDWEIVGRDIVVASSDTLHSRAHRYTRALWDQFGVVCFDESHHIVATTLVNVYFHCMRAPICISLTGTPYRKDGLTHALEWFTGPNVATMKNEEHVLVQPLLYSPSIPKIKHKYGPAKGKSNHAAMVSALAGYAPRTHTVARMIAKLLEHDRKVLVLADRVSLRKDLASALRRMVALKIRGHPLKLETVNVNAQLAVLQKQLDAWDLCHYLRDQSVHVVDPAPKVDTLSPDAQAQVRGRTIPTRSAPTICEDTSAPCGSLPAISELQCGDSILARMEKYRSKCILATYSMAREALDIYGLNALVFATPVSDVKQAVNRIRRGHHATTADTVPSSSSILHSPCGIVMDVVDRIDPFASQARSRQRHYKDDPYIDVKSHIALEDWLVTAPT